MKHFLREKGAYPLLLAALLLVMQPLTTAPFSSAPGSGKHALHHGCGCQAAKAAAGACGCAVSCCPCCPGPGGQPPATAIRPTSRDAPAVHLRVLPCGGREDLSINPSGIKFILTAFPEALVEGSIPYGESSPKKPEKPSPQPSVPPPKNAPPSLTALA